MKSRPICLLLCAILLSACQQSTPPIDEVTTASKVHLMEGPARAESFAPNITIGHAGQLLLSWLEPGKEDRHTLLYSILDVGGWSEPSIVAFGDGWFANWADFPSVNAISNELWVAHWLQGRPAGGYAYDVTAVISTDRGKSWSAPFNPHTDDTDTEHGFVTMFPDGDGVGMVWLDGRKFVNEVTDDVVASGMTLRSATFSLDAEPSNERLVDELICDCCQTDVAVTPDGPVAVYRNRTEDEIRDIYVTRRLGDEWQPGVPVSDDHWEIPGCPVNGPVIQANGPNVAVTWFSAPNEKGRIQAAWSSDSGATFGTPVLIADDHPTGHVGSAMLENGDLIVSWQRRIENGGAELCLRRVSASGEMSETRAIEEAADMFAISVPQIALHDDHLVLAWTTAIDNRYSVETALVPIDYIQ